MLETPMSEQKKVEKTEGYLAVHWVRLFLWVLPWVDQMAVTRASANKWGPQWVPQLECEWDEWGR